MGSLDCANLASTMDTCIQFAAIPCSGCWKQCWSVSLFVVARGWRRRGAWPSPPDDISAKASACQVTESYGPFSVARSVDRPATFNSKDGEKGGMWRGASHILGDLAFRRASDDEAMTVLIQSDLTGRSTYFAWSCSAVLTNESLRRTLCPDRRQVTCAVCTTGPCAGLICV